MHGGERMDMFMDKLAQKLTAQEIIKANTTAEAEELNRLRNQIEEYDRCLARLQQLLDEGAEKLQGSAPENGGSGSISEESMEQLSNSMSVHFEEADRKLGERLGNVNRILSERLENMDKSVEEQLNDMDVSMGNQLTSANESVLGALKNMENSLDEKLSPLDEKLSRLDSMLEEKEEEKEEEPLADRLLPITENIHKECVKVYRNVQAVVVEENGKQTETLSNTATGVQRVGKKLNTVFGISLAALLISLLGVVMQILNMMNINLF